MACAAMALVLWTVCYAAFWGLAFAGVSPWVAEGRAPGMAHLVAGLMLALLAVDAAGRVRSGWCSRESEAGFSATAKVAREDAADRGTWTSWRRLAGTCAARVLFCAPCVTATAVRVWRGQVRLPQRKLAAAQRIAEQLRGHRDWVPAHRYESYAAVMVALCKLKVVWLRSRRGQMMVRVDPGYCE